MKKVAIVLSFVLFSASPMLPAQETPEMTQQAVTVQEYDAQIAQLKQDIARYNGMASMYGQQAQLVEFRDFDGYRDASALQERCLAVVKELKEHLAILEKQKAALENSSTVPEKKCP